MNAVIGAVARMQPAPAPSPGSRDVGGGREADWDSADGRLAYTRRYVLSFRSTIGTDSVVVIVVCSFRLPLRVSD